jgi:hypothetical protein
VLLCKGMAVDSLKYCAHNRKEGHKHTTPASGMQEAIAF